MEFGKRDAALAGDGVEQIDFVALLVDAGVAQLTGRFVYRPALGWFQGQSGTLVIGLGQQNGEGRGGLPLIPVRSQVNCGAEDVLWVVTGAGIEDVEDVVAHEQGGMPLVDVKEDRSRFEICVSVAAAENYAGHTQGVNPAVGGVGIEEDPKIARTEDLLVGAKIDTILRSGQQRTLSIQGGIPLFQGIGFKILRPHKRSVIVHQNAAVLFVDMHVRAGNMIVAGGLFQT